MLEKNMREELRRCLSYKWMVQRIEGNVGIPDLFVGYGNNVWWIELKVVEKKSFSFNIPFRPGQYRWLKTAYDKHKLNVALLLYYNNKYFLLKNKAIQTAYTADVLYQKASFIQCELMDIDNALIIDEGYQRKVNRRTKCSG